MVIAKKNKNKRRYPGCLAHAVRGVFYSVVTHRLQPNPYIYTRYIIEWPESYDQKRGGGGSTEGNSGRYVGQRGGGGRTPACLLPERSTVTFIFLLPIAVLL